MALRFNEQFIFFFSSAQVHALHLPYLSKVIRGLVDMFRQVLHQKISLQNS